MTESLNDQTPRPRRSWVRKFLDAGHGIRVAVRSEASFSVHLIATLVVALLGIAFGFSWNEWCLTVLCIGMVWAVELLNTCIERLARTITRETNPDIRDALDIASGAVLAISISAAVVGGIVFLPRLLCLI